MSDGIDLCLWFVALTFGAGVLSCRLDEVQVIGSAIADVVTC